MGNKIIFVLLGAIFLAQCSKVPVTGRSQPDIVPNGEMLALADASYKDFLSQHKTSSDATKTAEVKRVGQNIAGAVEKYMSDNGRKKELKGYSWKFNLVDSKEQNAWCMPGGKVVVYSGILPVAQNETGLAVVMGHEIAHAIAKHGNERMSQQLVTQLGGVALQVALKDKPAQTQSLFYAAYGAGTTVGVLLPYSRLQESEADRLGLIFMAMADYDPREAIEFWKRMDASGGGGTPEFLSTHPAHETRIKDIEKHLPEALKYYNNSKISKK
ncbi:MAG: M48 family metallopeptidase [Cytophagaceae bacterium]|nr:M48 family metallopeptidase [Cytophagaceae bacterium]